MGRAMPSWASLLEKTRGGTSKEWGDEEGKECMVMPFYCKGTFWGEGTLLERVRRQGLGFMGFKGLGV